MQSSSSANDQNLLLGMLAFQLDFVTQKDLVETMQAWMIDKSRPLGELLLERDLVNADRLKLLNSLVAEHIKEHENDPQKSLASMRLPESICNPLRSLGDPEVARLMGGDGEANAAVEAGEGQFATLLPSNEARQADSRRFVNLRPLAEGGLGIVSVAMDTELTREVALKEIKPRSADNLDSRARFLKEAEITGKLEHPGIVPVYGLGAYSDGRPYYAMRMIIGVSLKEAIADYHNDTQSDDGQKRLAMRELLQRFIDVCNAMEYAHSRGIVHRDLKPANIMLGKYRETLVVDWGLAKSVGETEQQVTSDETVIVPELGAESLPTRMGEVVGTLGFMSPEQAGGRAKEAGPLIDVYSLGATLYNVLTGTVAFKDGTAATLLRNVQLGKFPRPREVKKDIPASLEAICLQAMARDPRGRYQSAKALADDIEHYLADEPVSAYREPPHLRMRRWMRKHPKTVSTIVTVVLGGLIGFGAVAGVLNRKNQELQVAKENAEDAQHVAEQVKEYMVEAFRSPDPEADGKTITVYEVLSRLSADDIQSQVGDQRIAADLDQTIGQTLTGLGLYAEAVPFLEKSHELIVAAFGLEDRRTRASTDRLANCYSEAGLHQKAIPLFEDALKRAREKFGAEHADTLGTMNNLAAAFQGAERYDEALPLLEQAFEMTQTQLGPQHPGTLATMNNLAAGYQRANRLDKALPLAKETLQLAQQLFGPDHLNTSRAMKTMAVIYQADGQLDESLTLAQSTVNIRQSKLGEDHPETLSAMDLLHDIQLNKGEFAAAETGVRKWIGFLEQSKYRNEEAIHRARTGLASALWGQEKWADAIATVRSTVTSFADADPSNDTLRCLSILSSAAAHQGKWELAEPKLISAYEQLKSRLPRIRPAQRWTVQRACERVLDGYRLQEDTAQETKWSQELNEITERIRQMRSSGSSSSS